MSAFTKFKIVSLFSFSGPRVQRFSKGCQNDGGSKKDADKNGSRLKKELKFDAFKLSKDKLNPNCFVSDANANYMEYLFSKWIRNPDSVHKVKSKIIIPFHKLCIQYMRFYDSPGSYILMTFCKVIVWVK